MEYFSEKKFVEKNESGRKLKSQNTRKIQPCTVILKIMTKVTKLLLKIRMLRIPVISFIREPLLNGKAQYC